MDALTMETPGLTVERYAEAKGLDVAKLAKWGVTTEPSPFKDPEGAGYEILGPPGTPCVGFRYLDLNGDLVRIKYRGQAGTVWGAGDTIIPYGLQWLPQIPVRRPLLVVEGESDSNSGWTRGVPTIGLPGNATWRTEWTLYLVDRPLFVWYEPMRPGKTVDAGGRMCGMIAADRADAKVIRPPAGIKDLNELHLAAGNGFDSELRALMDAAQPIRDVVIPAPRVRTDIRLVRHHPRLPGRDNLDVEKAKAVPIDQLMWRLGFDLKRRGREWAMVCPFHEDSNPSLRLNVGKGVWRCDPCGIGGDSIEFMRRWQGLSFPDAVRAVSA